MAQQKPYNYTAFPENDPSQKAAPAAGTADTTATAAAKVPGGRTTDKLK
jgi:hypothetical protein